MHSKVGIVRTVWTAVSGAISMGGISYVALIGYLCWDVPVGASPQHGVVHAAWVAARHWFLLTPFGQRCIVLGGAPASCEQAQWRTGRDLAALPPPPQRGGLRLRPRGVDHAPSRFARALSTLSNARMVSWWHQAVLQSQDVLGNDWDG